MPSFLLGLVLFAFAVQPVLAASKPKTAAAAVAPERKVDAVLLSALKARSIGPAIMGGRVSEIALDPQSPNVFYVALGTGGLMKTTDNGATFQAVFEKEAVASIGAVAVAPSDPKVVWVGTGEANDRNSSSWGNGIYRSADGGDTWAHVGLADSKVIARIAVHPNDPHTAWVAVLGDLWVPSPSRGLHKTTDGGKTWKLVLQAPAPYSTKVGCGEVVLDPSDPSVLYAAVYARQRSPWSLTVGPECTDGKDLGGIFKSSDGGATWKKLVNGLPGRTARIGLDVSRKNPKVVYAIVQSDEGGQTDIDALRSKRGGVFRSEDAGETWVRTNPLNPRSFYFSQIRVDPSNDQRVYVLGYAMHVSEDGGKTYREDCFQKVHPDCHALAIDPRDPKRLILGTDGGPYLSYDGGKGWAHLNNMAAGEYYRITVDMSTPYRIAGGLQDNTNWVGPSMTWSKEGIRNCDWQNIGGGDGFYCVFDADDPNIVYAEGQEGYAHRVNLGNGELKELRPQPAEGNPAFRFHWASPLIPSPHRKGVIYLAGNVVFEMTNKGEEWRVISPDLSTQDPKKTTSVGSGAENYGVVYTLAESPIKPGLLWAGTDDGKLWRCDAGVWTDLTTNLPAPVKGQWIGRIEAGHFDPAVAYLAIDAHRTGLYSPFAYRTSDAGKTWRPVASDLPPDGPVKVVREDVKNPKLLFAGTEFGLFASLDQGAHWNRFGDLPTVAVDDIVIHPRDMDLIVGTHGRSIYIVDDIRPLQELTSEVLEREATLFSIRPAFGRYQLLDWTDSAGNAVYRGANPPEGAIINLFVKDFTGQPAKITITNAQGQAVASLTTPGTPGINRVTWDLKPTKDLMITYGGLGYKFLATGDYDVALAYGKTKQTQKLHVEIAPGIETR
ncbi:MAG: hypothetical protein AB1714_12685 [Acidobacteriota bacterium]